ncbi:MAG: DUF2232 domain-containing protein [Desulfurivibrionaceae bacterium]|nr:DUF2232 domain-containing protein [Desulfobulbales bacterium]MDT8335294.1 DUF2232 domain-containing protein [Desulfurivibrionaceae bacterium]
MADSRDGIISRLKIDPAGVAIAFTVWILPIVSIEFIWLQLFTPLPLFYYLVEPGRGRGVNTLAAALLITGLAATASGAATAFFFLVTMMPAGYMLAAGMAANTGPVRTGLGAFIALLLSWWAWSLLYSISNHAGLYQDILTSLDQGLIAAGEAVLVSSELSAEHAAAFETAIERLGDLIPRIMPGLLLVSLLNVVFLNMITGQWLLKRKDPALSSWPPFAEWRLPERMVGVIIAAGIFLLLPGGLLNDTGLNLILIAGTLYFFQGLAVINGLLTRWNAPLWILFLSLIFFQVYGIIFLAVLGLADVWVDFRKKQIESDNDKSEE